MDIGCTSCLHCLSVVRSLAFLGRRSSSSIVVLLSEEKKIDESEKRKKIVVYSLVFG